ncbi:unnamed protein product [Phaeothamnion confervicola]
MLSPSSLRSACLARSCQPFTAEEHYAFLDALERYGQSEYGNAWGLIAERVGSRPAHEVFVHAHRYFLQLQAHMGAGKVSGHGSASTEGLELLADDSWTADEDAIFENSLAAVDEEDECRWEKISSLLPGRTADHVRLRYQRLVYDVSLIETGHSAPITLNYRAPGDPIPTAATPPAVSAAVAAAAPPPAVSTVAAAAAAAMGGKLRSIESPPKKNDMGYVADAPARSRGHAWPNDEETACVTAVTAESNGDSGCSGNVSSGDDGRGGNTGDGGGDSNGAVAAKPALQGPADTYGESAAVPAAAAVTASAEGVHSARRQNGNSRNGGSAWTGGEGAAEPEAAAKGRDAAPPAHAGATPSVPAVSWTLAAMAVSTFTNGITDGLSAMPPPSLGAMCGGSVGEDGSSVAMPVTAMNVGDATAAPAAGSEAAA